MGKGPILQGWVLSTKNGVVDYRSTAFKMSIMRVTNNLCVIDMDARGRLVFGGLVWVKGADFAHLTAFTGTAVDVRCLFALKSCNRLF
ncbi:hypothetical protein TMES_20035 [Thalassospira mesophila]|uniref:Uncharacterized protein n=1 Tax=Thalassospira mesophila TaxID=1293891 RepID=A0A1Y2KWA7_9PROT|nr:hypothetical protein TMES_20035 [Thalassospira mesophila]